MLTVMRSVSEGQQQCVADAAALFSPTLAQLTLMCHLVKLDKTRQEV